MYERTIAFGMVFMEFPIHEFVYPHTSRYGNMPIVGWVNGYAYKVYIWQSRDVLYIVILIDLPFVAVPYLNAAWRSVSNVASASVELAIGELHVSEIIVFRSSRQQGRYEFFKFVVFLSLFSNVCRVPFPVVWIQQIVSHRTLVDALSLRRRIESIVLYVAVVDIEAQIVCIANLTVGNIYLYNAKSCCHHGIFAIHIYIIDSLVFCH